MQSNSKGDVELSVTLDTSRLRKDTDKIKKELQQNLKRTDEDVNLEFHTNTREIEDAEKELGSLSSAAQEATASIDTLSAVSNNMRDIAISALEAAASMEDAKKQADFTQVAESLWNTADKVDELSNSMQNVSDASQIAQNIEAVKASASELFVVINEAAQGMDELATASNGINDLSSIGVEANNLAHSMSEIEGISSALADASASTDNMAGEAEAIASAMDDTARTSSQAAVEANNLSTALKAVGDLTVALGALENLTGLPESLEAVAKALKKVSNADSGIEENAQGIENVTEPLEELSNTADNTAEALQKVKDMFLKDTGGDLEALNQFIQAYDALPKEAKEAFDKWKESLKEVKEETKETASVIEETQQLSSEVGKEEPRVTYLSPKEQELTRKLFGEDALSELMMIVAEKGQEAGKEFLNNLLAGLKQNKQEVQEELTEEPLHYEFRLDIPKDETYKEQLDRLKETAKSAQEELTKLTSGFKYSNEYQQVTEDVNDVQKELTSVNQKLADMERIGQTGTEEYDKLANKAFQLEKVLEDAKAVQQDIIDDGKKYTIGVDDEAIQEAQNRVDVLTKKISLLQQNIKIGGEAWKQLTPDEQYSMFVSKLKINWQEVGDVIKKHALPAVKKMASNLAKFAASAIKNGVKSLVSMFKKLTPQVNTTNKSLATGVKQLLKYALGISSVLMLFNKLRAAITEGMRNLAQWRDGNNEVNENLSVFISSLLQLKNQLAAAFAPILNIVVPILNTFIDSLIDATNYLAQFIAKLAGQDTWIKALKVQKNYADSLNKTGKAAKDASGKLAKFDDLDVLNQKNTGDGGIDPNDMFEEMPIESVEENVEDWIDKLKTAWETGDFTDIGSAIGQRLLEALSDIPWSDIQEKARKLAHSIATLLNGFFETEGLGAKIGETLAQAFRTAFVFIDEFVHTLHWDSIGTFIGESLVSFITNFPWDEAGHALGGAIVGVITTAYYTVKTFTDQGGWQELINGIITFVQSFLEEMNKVGDDGLNGWQKLGQTLYMTIHGILTSITDLINNLPIDDIMDGLNQAADEANGSELINDFMNLGKAIVNAISAVLKKVSWDEVGDAIGEMLNTGIEALPELLELAGTIISAIATALFNAVDTVTSEHPLTTDIAALIGAAMLAMKASQIAPGAVAAVKDAITYALAGGTGALALGIKVVIAVIVAKISFDFGKWLGGVLFPDNKPFVQVTIDDLIGSPKDTLNGMKMWFQDIAEGLWEVVINPLWSLISGVPSYLIDGLINGWEEEGIVNIDGAMRRMFGPFLDVCNGLIEWVKDIFGIHSPSTVMRDIAINIVEGMINGFDEMKDKVGEIWTHIKDAIFEKVTLIKDSVMNKINGFKLLFLGAFVEVQSKFISIWNKIKDGIKSPINAIIGMVESLVNKVIDAINGLTGKLNGLSGSGIKFTNPISGKTTSFDLPKISQLQHISIPRLAQGAVIPPNREFMAMLGDQTSGTNIEAPLDTITEAFADVVGSMRSTGNAVMQLDGQTFARLVVPYVMGELDRRGYNVKVLEA